MMGHQSWIRQVPTSNKTKEVGLFPGPLLHIVVEYHQVSNYTSSSGGRRHTWDKVAKGMRKNRNYSRVCLSFASRFDNDVHTGLGVAGAVHFATAARCAMHAKCQQCECWFRFTHGRWDDWILHHVHKYCLRECWQIFLFLHPIDIGDKSLRTNKNLSAGLTTIDGSALR